MQSRFKSDGARPTDRQTLERQSDTSDNPPFRARACAYKLAAFAAFGLFGCLGFRRFSRPSHAYAHMRARGGVSTLGNYIFNLASDSGVMDVGGNPAFQGG